MSYNGDNWDKCINEGINEGIREGIREGINKPCTGNHNTEKKNVSTLVIMHYALFMYNTVGFTIPYDDAFIMH